jgi:CBS domain-containing protein
LLQTPIRVHDLGVTESIADFLGDQPPFDALDADDLTLLAARAGEVAFPVGAVVVDAQEVLEHLWVVRSGALEVLDRGQVLDLLGVGDTFGHLSLLTRLPVGLVVRAHEASECLRIPDPRGFLSHPQRLRFGDAASVSRRRMITDHRPDRRLADVMRPVVWCGADDRVRDVADRIGAAADTCALVRLDAGIGIVTDHDFRRAVAAGRADPYSAVAPLASVPALAIDENADRAAALLRMVEHGVHHLVVTGAAGDPIGVVRAVDLTQAEIRDPLVIRSAVDSAGTLDELARAYALLPATLEELRRAGVPAFQIGAVQSAVVEAVIRRRLDLKPSATLASVRHSWLMLGSFARREPLPQSDLDTALLWADPPPDVADPADAIRAAAAEVLDDLGHCGLTPCPNGANATNPLFSRSQSAWTAAAKGWLRDPSKAGALLLSSIVVDSRPITDTALGLHIADAIRAHIRTLPFMRALLDQSLGWRPPTGFFREFVVHHSGEHRGHLDLKRGGLAPVVALGRWIAIAVGDSHGTTPERLARGAEAGLLTDDELHTLVGGFENVYSLLLDHESRAISAGETPTTYLSPKDLDSLTRRHLRETFRAIIAVQTTADQHWTRRLFR